ncbi:MAG: recombinase family protein, partial [Candidatus Competibacter sp.]
MPDERSDLTAVIYCRVSTVRQAEDELPIQSQLQRCEEKAAGLGATVLRVYSDEGLSGQSDSRPAFQQAILYCEANSPTYFITWSTSRFARSVLDAQIYKRRLSRAGTDLVYASIEIDRGSQGGWLTERTMEIFDEFFARQVSADTRRSMIKAAQSGYWCGGYTPFGYRPVLAADDPKRKRLEPVPEEIIIVRQIFELRARGTGAKTIAVTLNASGQLNRRRPWNKASVLSILRSQAVIGHLVFGREMRVDGERCSVDPSDWIIVDAHQPIVSRELWDTVQNMLDAAAPSCSSERGSPHSTYLFTGLLRCGQCGASLQIETAKGRSRRYPYYNCSNAQRQGSCGPKRYPAREFDEWLLDTISGEILTLTSLREVTKNLRDIAGNWRIERSERRSGIESQIGIIFRRNAKLYEVLEDLGRDAPNLGDIAQRLRQNNHQIKQLREEITRIDSEVPPRCEVKDEQLADLSSWLTTFMRQEYNVRQTRALFSDFISQITVDSASVMIEYSPGKMIGAIPAASCRLVPSTAIWLP